jgi:phage shock protein A
VAVQVAADPGALGDSDRADEDSVSASETESETEPEMTPQAIDKVQTVLQELVQSHARVRSNYERAKRNLQKERRRNWKVKSAYTTLKGKVGRLRYELEAGKAKLAEVEKELTAMNTKYEKLVTSLTLIIPVV